MNKFFRRQFWLISAFVKRYYRVIITSLVLSVIAGLLANHYLAKLPPKQTSVRLGVIGQYSSQSLPNLVKNILNSGLTKIGPNQTILPNLAEKWEVGENGKVYTFTMKPDLTWSDGTPVKTKDFALNIPDVNIQYPSDNQIVFVLPQPFAPFPSAMNNPIANKNGLTISDYTVSLTQNTNGILSKIRLQSNDKNIEIRIFGSPTQALTSFKLGEINAIYNYPKVASPEPNQYGQVREISNFHQALAILFNNQDPLLKDKGIRQGIAYAIKDKTFGNERALGPISASSWAYNPLVKLYDYDIDHATRLIRSALPDKSQSINLELATIPQYLSIAEKIKQELDSSLVTLNIKVVTSRPETYQLYLTLFEIPTDPDQYVFWHSSHGTNNISKVDNEKIDKDLEDARRTIDQAERKRLYNDFQRTFGEELPTLFLFYPRYYSFARRKAIFDIIRPETAL
ncbi:hypothetical protein A3A84_01385 [Candidatus Collierbacteria bacterium RIFCSPLOWO2_01_FULL_50_23]|uniref:Solute-binding protein family 5 domain-containing protein n=1 Tax=Candidatus Collierbacteria bacterium RIFCSPHIGHO2_01_FULL_50_25 TaxID=1817722 RepID=A0A1F5EYM5_9BACT|nr:MAG: hypothetical protein A2703_01790 [Candidatus Collierbacteria bacterium RIFCSPHIGHO2_01_FULL_50_25]OGD75054.1 MAG: hypothetical protein A3A84_01385 [Candidatus Collierbacteria bacterium RIFCSPLOWO2_01_FULL_50_23]